MSNTTPDTTLDPAFAAGARRMIDTMLRNAHSRSVSLRISAPAVAGDDAEQLGQATPLFQDVELKPAIFRKSYASAKQGRVTRELLLSATTVQTLIDTHGFASASNLFANAFGIVVDGTLLPIEDATEVEAGGILCGYRLELISGSAS